MDIVSVLLLSTFFAAILLAVLSATRRKSVNTQKAAVQLDSESIRGVAGTLARNQKAGEGRDHTSQAMLTRAAGDIRKARKALAAIPEDEDIVPAGRWILDNFFMVEQEIFRVQNMLKSGPQRLPIMKVDSIPRVCWISDNLLSYTNGRLDTETLVMYLNEYQKKTPLMLKELWVLPAFLRLAVLKRIAEVAFACTDTQQQWDSAEAFAEYMAQNPGSEQVWLARSRKIPWMKRDNMGGAFLERLSMRLMEQGEGAAAQLKWLDELLSERGFILEDQIASSHHRQGGEKLLIGNCMDSLRYLDALNWLDLFRMVSVVERTLMEDPSGVYKQMDELSRGMYRRRVEQLAERWHVSELHLSRLAVLCATERVNSSYDKERHIGYYVVGDGNDFLADRVKGRRYRLRRKTKLLFYSSSIWIVSAALAVGLACLLPGGLAIKCAAFVAALLAFTKPAVFLVDEVVKSRVRSEVIPAIDLKDGIPDDGRTLITIPALLPNRERLQKLMEQLETLYIRHGSGNIRYCLLVDHKDEREPDEEKDRVLAEAGVRAAEALNKQYKEGTFHFLVRKRQYNASEGVYMGMERKRGAIMALNRLLLDGDVSEFDSLEAQPEGLRDIRYVLTLDADTELPHDAAARLIGIMLHPLNRPEVESGAVRKGYGILQPRVEMASGCSRQSKFTAAYTGKCGLDHYSGAIADIYQDLFNEGIFTGKGLYHVKTFMEVLEGKLPDNRILSHDLLEGSYSRVGFVSDVAVVDGFPSNAYAYFMRMHRWLRGDWQISRWLGRKTPDGKPNPINHLSKYKIADNLRRALGAPAELLLLAFSAIAGRLWLGLLALAAIELLPPVVSLAKRLLAGNGTVGLSFKASGPDFLRPLLNLLFLPFEAWVAIDAAARSLYRMVISKKRLLEWTTAADAERGRPSSAAGYWKYMAAAPVISALLCVLAVISGATAAEKAWGVIVLLWAASPQVAWWISKAPLCTGCRMSAEETRMVRLIARRTWHYFERFVTAEEHWLAPDNFQEYPFKGVASRTSPTNIGLSLMADAAAKDLGYLTPRGMMERMNSTLESIATLQKWQGHLYNWYDTRTAEPLHPLYVSAVDSGNLMAYLLLAAEAVKEAATGPLVPYACLEGLADTVGVLLEKKPDAALEELASALSAATARRDMKAAPELLDRIAEAADRLGGKWATLAVDAIDAMIDDMEELLEALELLPNEYKVMLEGNWEEYASPAAWRGGGKAAQAVEAALKAGENKRLTEISLRLKDVFEDRVSVGEVLSERLRKTALEMNLTALYDKTRDLFYIGYALEQGKLGNSYYDLLASEARLTSLLGIAWGKIPARHWRKLGRALTVAGGGMPLLSWGGTMFEYLMPALILRHEPCTLLGETVRAAIRAQRDYAEAKGIPWGISESGYHEFDLNLNYQYRSFGVPDTGMRAGLTRDLVVAPYATLMALQFEPEEACSNVRKLMSMGMLGEYGMYEAVDFTPERRLEKDPFKIVKSYMVHHQGMALTAMTNLLGDDVMVERFHRIPQIRSVELLMEERAPTHGAVLDKCSADEEAPQRSRKPREVRMVRTFHMGEGLWPPEVQLLSNGSYLVHISASGAGQSRWEGQALNRWRDDAVTQEYGIFFYIRDTETGQAWTAALQPGVGKPDEYEVHFDPHMATFRRKDGDVATTMEVAVSSDSPAEVRRLTLANRAEKARRLEVTVYFEAVLNTQANDEAHPAFQNLFVQTESLPESGVVLVKRRPRDPKQGMPVMACRFVGENGPVAPIQFDTSREMCLGRGRSARNPQHMEGGRALGSTEGNVPDPAVCMRTSVSLEPMGCASVSFVIACGWDRQRVLQISDALAAPGAVDRAFEMAWTQEQANMRYLGVKPNQLRFYAAMSSYMLYGYPAVRTRLSALDGICRGQSALWELGISGDFPIIVLKVSDLEHLEAVRHLLLAHAWWRFKGIGVDLVLLNEYGNDYRRPLHDRLHDTVMTSHEREYLNRRGGVFIVTAGQIHPEACRTLHAVARCVLQAGQPLTAQLRPVACQPVTVDRERPKGERWDEVPLQETATVFHNGTGGFSEDGTEYIIELGEGQNTPMPWSNVLTNGSFGMIATESGAGYTWKDNSRENKLTPWYNDPVTGRSGEGLYVRDRESGEFWSLMPLPARGKGTYRARHGQGWTTWEYGGYGLLQESTMFVPFDGSLRIQLVKIYNPGPRIREIDVTWYCDFVMGAGRENSAAFLRVRRDPQSGALWAENGYRDEFIGEKVFMAAPGLEVSFTANRMEFLGVLGSLENPAGMYPDELSGGLGIGLGGCGVLRFRLKIPPGMSRQAVLLLGDAKDLGEIRAAVRQYTLYEQARDSLKATCRAWYRDLSTIRVKTPDSAMDLMVNGWLLYQTKASRVMGRAGFYQAGGAIGFRDQLQDMLALMWTAPAEVRLHILECAAHQFESGDVQHWWHPPMRGVRTRISDDLVFLPYVTADYIEHTGDTGILMEEVNYLKDVPIPDGQEDWYGVAEEAALREPLYQHCLQALRRAARKGPHGLPLIGTGDWNDAMNSVGDEGKGESVWLGWFLSFTQRKFADCLRLIDQNEEADALVAEAGEFERALEQEGWDGAWYRRAFFDDGTPLGSAINDECRIDCISQSWAAIAGSGEPARTESAMQAVEKHLISWEDGLLRLLWPPFINTAMEPGYIKGYLAGVRENGGQYTHAAVWAVWAFARMGQGDMAWRLLYLLNPIQHGNSTMAKDRYKVEPYVTAADVYSMPPLTGRGGWTWYTGSSAWMYRVVVEYQLGICLRGDKLYINPCIPSQWREYNIEYRHGRSRYLIRVENARGVSQGVRQVILDGRAMQDLAIPLKDDGETHYAHILMGKE